MITRVIACTISGAIVSIAGVQLWVWMTHPDGETAFMVGLVATFAVTFAAGMLGMLFDARS